MWFDQSHTVKPWLVGLCKLCEVNGAIDFLRVKETTSQWEVIWGYSLLGGLWETCVWLSQLGSSARSGNG